MSEELNSLIRRLKKLGVAGRTGLPIGTRVRILSSRPGLEKGTVGALYPLKRGDKGSVARMKVLGTGNRRDKFVREELLTPDDVWDVIYNPLLDHLEVSSSDVL